MVKHTLSALVFASIVVSLFYAICSYLNLWDIVLTKQFVVISAVLCLTYILKYVTIDRIKEIDQKATETQ